MVGGADRRKNTEMVVQAFARIKTGAGIAPGLVVVGNYPQDYRDCLASLYRSTGGREGYLHFVTGLPDTDLAKLYRHAIATLCPSQIEGFSVPVVEAMACGSPVLASDIDAHRELVTQPEARFPSDDAEALTALLGRVAAEQALRQRLAEKQRPVTSHFTEDAVAGRFWEPVFAEFDSRHHTTPHMRRASSKPRLAFLTPYPPDRSGVADYTAQTLRYLADHAVIDVYTDAQPTSEHPCVRRFASLTELPYLSPEYDGVIAVVGNSHFHTRIIDYHNRYGGACLVHDNRLAELYWWWRGRDYFAKMASRSLGRPVSADEAESWVHDPGRLPSIFFDEVLVKADPLIVHSRGIQAQVARQYGKEAAYLPFCCYRHFTDAELTDAARTQARARLGIPTDRVVVISLGIVGSAKAPQECLWALEQLRAWGIPAHLYFVGSATGMEATLRTIAEELRITTHVHLLADWVSGEKYRDFLLAADYAIQLRTHFFGGLSGALLDCISAGLPTVANEDLAEAMDGPDYVYRVPDRLSPVLIAERIADSLATGAHRSRTSALRQQYVCEHSFSNYAAQMMQVLGLN
jgi:glycosyltransferase involved in cell wall biosynthesis